ncbi:MAG: hypothetical protein U1E78_05270 [Gammaproteobacteria bacterium]
MYDLNVNEATAVSGGNNDVLGALLVLGGIVTLGTIAAIGSTPRRTPYCRQVITPFTEETPVYDPYTGRFLGTQINSYEKTETICT